MVRMKCAHKRTTYTFTPQHKWNEENKRSSNEMLSRNELFMGIKITECACNDVASRWFSLNVEEEDTVKWEFVFMLCNYSKYRNKCNKDVCYFAVSGVRWIVCPVEIEHLGATRAIRMSRQFSSFNLEEILIPFRLIDTIFQARSVLQSLWIVWTTTSIDLQFLNEYIHLWAILK